MTDREHVEEMAEADADLTYERDGVVWCVWAMHEGCPELHVIKETRVDADREVARTREDDPDIDIWLESWLVGAGVRPRGGRRPKAHGVVWQDADRVGGALCWDSTRVPVEDTLAALMIGGQGAYEYLENYPSVDRDHLLGLVDALHAALEAEESKATRPDETGTEESE